MPKKKLILNIIRIIFLLAPVLWLAFAVDYRSMAKQFLTVHWIWIFFLFAVIFLHFILQSLRFWVLLSLFSQKIKLGSFIILNWKARYYSAILPSSAGIDLSRGVLLKDSFSLSQIIAGTLFFRITGMITLSILSVFGFFYLYAEQEITAAIIAVALLLFVLIGSLTVALSERASKKYQPFVEKILPRKFANFVANASESIRLYKKHPKIVIINIILSFSTHLVYIMFPIAAIFAVSQELKIIESFAFIPLIEIISASVPISPNGAGVREGLSILFFDFIGLSKEQALSYVALSIIMYIWMFSGFFVILAEKARKCAKKKLAAEKDREQIN